MDPVRHKNNRLRKRRNAISAQFAPRLIEMLESPAYRVLSLSAHRVLSRIEVEHAHHGGTDNGKLPVTFDQFEAYGVHRRAIPPAIRELEALGFAVVTERGRAGNAEFRSPNLFRLTYRHAEGIDGDGSHEWRKIETMEKAIATAEAARKPIRIPSKNRIPVAENALLPVAENALQTSNSIGRKPPLLS
jgi:hypothetical protein